MKTVKLVLLASAFVATGAFAASDGMMMDMKKIDANGDGMISKKEFMKHHEHMWSMMKKSKGGLVSVKDMEAMHADMMKDGSMMKDGAMKDGPMKDGMKKDGMMKDKMAK